jgi:pimeloyl-ACP methyl ester carboxylesterase
MTTFVNSADGTRIACDQVGAGPALVLVDGALCHRTAGPAGPLAAQLADRFTVHTYDRRGRGESTDTAPHAVAREVEDLRAVIAHAGGRAFVYGISSGAALALAAAAVDPGITALALYEPPFLPGGGEYRARLTDLLAAGRTEDALTLFLTTVGLPEPAVAGMRAQPGWAALVAIAPTLAYDAAVLDDGDVPRELAARVRVPALVLSGDASPQDLQGAAKATADALPAGEHRTLPGQTHDVAPDALAPVLAEFFGGL